MVLLESSAVKDDQQIDGAGDGRQSANRYLRQLIDGFEIEGDERENMSERGRMEGNGGISAIVKENRAFGEGR